MKEGSTKFYQNTKMITKIFLLILQLASVLSKGTKGLSQVPFFKEMLSENEAALNQALAANPEALEHWRA